MHRKKKNKGLHWAATLAMSRRNWGQGCSFASTISRVSLDIVNKFRKPMKQPQVLATDKPRFGTHTPCSHIVQSDTLVQRDSSHKGKLFEAPSRTMNPTQLPISQNFNFHLLTAAVRGVPNTIATEPLGKSEVAPSSLLHNPYTLRGPHQRGQNQKWLPHPCLLGGP